MFWLLSSSIITHVGFTDSLDNSLLKYWLQHVWIFITFILIIHLKVQLASVFGSFQLDGSCKVHHIEFFIIFCISNTFCFMIMKISHQIASLQNEIWEFVNSVISSVICSKGSVRFWLWTYCRLFEKNHAGVFI
jgi:hypothetical protein